jgi:outer membrane protein assembly factor BamE (lipoprotein component of BamABCDE complex)
MSFVNRKHFKIYYIIFFLFLLNNCQLNEPHKQHGINFLENRENGLVIGKTNKNDVIKLIGNPHSTSMKSDDTWIYFERTITRGKLIKLGQNVLKKNNVLELKFDKYGVLTVKKIINKDNMNKINYSKKITTNDISQQSFVGKFLSSVKQKMYGRRKKP